MNKFCNATGVAIVPVGYMQYLLCVTETPLLAIQIPRTDARQLSSGDPLPKVTSRDR